MNVPIKKREKIKVSSSTDVYAIMQKILLRENKFRRKQEYFWVLGLSTANRIEYIELVALGTVNSVNVDPMEVFSLALQKKCKQIILVHNHPSGTAKPSRSDKELTSTLKAGAKILKLKILDHIIITEKKFFSFLDEGEL